MLPDKKLIELAASQTDTDLRLSDLIIGRIFKKAYSNFDETAKKELEETFLSENIIKKEEFIKKYIPNFEELFAEELKKIEEEIKEEIEKQI